MEQADRIQLTEKITAHLCRMGAGRVWRPVAGPYGHVLNCGSGPDLTAMSAYVAGVDFAGKTVLDLGANLGLFTFMACRGGATWALGLDSDPDAVAGARMLAELHGLPNARFEVRDFLADESIPRADLVLVIDFIGRGVIVKSRLDTVLDAAVRLSRKEIFFTLRPEYPLSELRAPDHFLKRTYGRFIRDGRFYLAEHVAARLGAGWSATVLSRLCVEGKTLKTGVLFTRAEASDSGPVQE